MGGFIVAFLELRDIQKSYYLGKEAFPVLNGIDLDFELGEFVSILGESGGGKSTLMNIIGGLDRQFTGSVTIKGQKLDHTKEKQLDDYRRGTIGYIYQSYNLITHLNVLENVLVSLDMTELNGTQRKARAESLLAQVGLSDQIKKHPNQLSGGQKQRVAIARALASDPQIIIADEPTGALDSKNTQEVLGLLEQIAKDGKLVIAVTHSQEVAHHGTRIVHLEDGKINGDTRLKPAYPQSKKPDKIKPRQLSALASYRTAFKHLIYNFWRNSLIMLGTGIGIFAVLLFSGLGNGINDYIQDQINTMVNPHSVTLVKNASGRKMSTAKIQASMQEYANDPAKLAIDAHQVQHLKHIKGVSHVEPGYQFSNYTMSYGQHNVHGSSLQTWTKAYATNTIKLGHKPGASEIVLDKKQALQLNNNKNYKALLGKTVKVSLPTIDANNHPVQVTGQLKVVGFTNGGQAGSITSTDYQTMHDLLGKAKASTKANFVSVNVNNLKQVTQTAKRIQNYRDNGKYVFGAITVGDILKTVNRYVNLAATVLGAIAGISLIVSALMIIVTMYMSVSERTKEIGILRALGERKKDIRRLFTSESIFIGLFSAVLALILAYGASAALNQALFRLVKANIVQISGGNVIFAFAAAIIISFVAALLPARRASKLNPIDALSAD